MISSEDVENFQVVLEEGKNMLYLLQNHKIKTEANYQSKFFKYLDKPSISKLILPYLDFKDIAHLRMTCRLMNETCTSFTSFVLFRRRVIRENAKEEKRPQGLYNDEDESEPQSKEDFITRINTLKSVKDFLSDKLFQSEKVIKLYKNDLEYLKSENAGFNEIKERLQTELDESRNEVEEKKKETIVLKQKYETLNKKYEENKNESDQKIKDLSKEIEGLKSDKHKLTAAVVQLKKMTDDLKKKNISKAEALKAIKNFFMNSTLLNLKNVPEFTEQQANQKGKSEN